MSSGLKRFLTTLRSVRNDIENKVRKAGCRDYPIIKNHEPRLNKYDNIVIPMALFAPEESFQSKIKPFYPKLTLIS